MYRLVDILNFIGKVNLIKVGSFTDDAYHYLNTVGNVWVDVIDVIRGKDGYATVIIERTEG